jgi:Fe-S-cluster containining protein
VLRKFNLQQICGMRDKIEEIEHRFEQLLREIEKSSTQLHKQHIDQTVCKKGCDKCCMNFNLLPVEFYSILSSIKGKPIKIELTGNTDSCPFLSDHTCQIYQFRPSICRSHGLPILNMDEEGENWELSYCPLNFTQSDEDYFTHENCFQQDLFNSKLYLLNQEFITSFQESLYTKSDMLDLRTLAKHLLKP